MKNKSFLARGKRLPVPGRDATINLGNGMRACMHAHGGVCVFGEEKGNEHWGASYGHDGENAAERKRKNCDVCAQWLPWSSPTSLGA